jgi:GT2 family glycosyltransferase
VKIPVKSRQSKAGAKACELETAFSRAGERRFSGYVVDRNYLSRKFAVEIFVDGFSVRVLRADAYVDELAQNGLGDGCYGFSCTLPETVLGDSAFIEARLANIGTIIGQPIVLAESSGQPQQRSGSGHVRWLGGLRFSGWIATREDDAIAQVFVDGALVAKVRASAWRHVGTSEDNVQVVRGFDLHLPESFADGRAHYLALTSEAGETVGAKALAFVAYPDGLRELAVGAGISEQDQLRAQLFDQQVPMSLPFSAYQRWRERFPTEIEPSAIVQCAVILVGPGTLQHSLDSLNEQSNSEWIAASLPQASEPADLEPELVSAFLETDGADCEFVFFALAGTLFSSSAFDRITRAFAAFPDAQAVYADFDLKSDDGSAWPIALSAFDYERMLEQGYCSYLFALRRSVALQLLQKKKPPNLYRLFNSIFDDDTWSSDAIVHLPDPIATLPTFDKEAAVEALAEAAIDHLDQQESAAEATVQPGGLFPAVKVRRMFDPIRTTIVIPTRNRDDLLQRCLESIRAAVERAQAEVLIVDNDSSDPATLDYLAELEKRGATILRVPGEFNFPRLNNLAAEAAKGDVLCLLNNDIEAVDDDWLDEMLSRIGPSDVGAVGAQLVWPSKIIQHGGVVLGPNFSGTHAFMDRIDGDVGYSDLLCVAHECSAVTAACMLTRRSDYLDVGGMDEVLFPVNFNDVDYCLKLRAAGKRIVFTPHAKLIHIEAASRNEELNVDAKARFERERLSLQAKWGRVIAADSYYSPILSLDPLPFSALAWPMRSTAPRINSRPVPVSVPSGF